MLQLNVYQGDPGSMPRRIQNHKYYNFPLQLHPLNTESSVLFPVSIKWMEEQPKYGVIWRFPNFFLYIKATMQFRVYNVIQWSRLGNRNLEWRIHTHSEDLTSSALLNGLQQYKRFERTGEMDMVKHQLLGYWQSKCNHVYLEIIILYFGSTKYFSVCMAKTEVLGQSISELTE